MEGLHLVQLKGFLQNIEILVVGPEDSLLFKSDINIPTMDGNTQTLKVSTFSCADDLANVKEGTYVYIGGHIETKPAVSRCRNCGGRITQYWTNIVIDDFQILNKGDEDGY